MTRENANPFVLPGFGQTGELAGNPVMASMEMMRQAWQSLAGQGGLGAPSMAVPLSVQELERRITDLRAVENWLRMNLTVLSNTIQSLEVQRATLSTLKSFVHNASAVAGQDAAALESLFGFKSANSATASDEYAQTAPRSSSAQQAADADAAPRTVPLFDADQAVAATQAWWDVLRQQFDSLAAATAASMPSDPSVAAASNAAPAPAAAAKPPRKTAVAKPKAGKSPASRAPTSGSKSATGRSRSGR